MFSAEQPDTNTAFQVFSFFFPPTSSALEEWGWSIEKLNSDPIIGTFLEGFAVIMSLKNLYPAGLFSLPQVFSSTSCLLIVLSFNKLLQLFLPLSRQMQTWAERRLAFKATVSLKCAFSCERLGGDWKSARVHVYRWSDYSPPVTFFKGLCKIY